MLLINQSVTFHLHHYCLFFQFFYQNKKTDLGAVTFSEPTLSFKKNLIIVNISLIKHVPFITFGENRKDTNKNFWYQTWSHLNKEVSDFFSAKGKMELNNETTEIVIPRSSHPEVFCKTGVQEISQNTPENTCARVSSFIKLQTKPCNFIKKESRAQMFPVNLVKFLRTTFLTEHLRWLLLDT